MVNDVKDVDKKAAVCRGDTPPWRVIRPRFERGTVCLEGRCSIQLSYRTYLGEAVMAFMDAKLAIFGLMAKFF